MTSKIKMVEYVRVTKDVRYSARCTCPQSEQIVINQLFVKVSRV